MEKLGRLWHIKVPHAGMTKENTQVNALFSGVACSSSVYPDRLYCIVKTTKQPTKQNHISVLKSVRDYPCTQTHSDRQTRSSVSSWKLIKKKNGKKKITGLKSYCFNFHIQKSVYSKWIGRLDLDLQQVIFQLEG